MVKVSSEMACGSCGKRGRFINCQQCNLPFHARCLPGAPLLQEAIGKQWTCFLCKGNKNDVSEKAGEDDRSMENPQNVERRGSRKRKGTEEKGKEEATFKPENELIEKKFVNGHVENLVSASPNNDGNSESVTCDLRRSKRLKVKVETNDAILLSEKKSKVTFSEAEIVKDEGKTRRSSKISFGESEVMKDVKVVVDDEEREKGEEKDKGMEERNKTAASGNFEEEGLESVHGEETTENSDRKVGKKQINENETENARIRNLGKRPVELSDPVPIVDEDEDEDKDDIQEEGNGVGMQGEGVIARNRARYLKIAQSRAAHFAHFAGDNSEDNAGEGTSEQHDWPGPFQVARRLVEGRDAALTAREDAKIVGETREKKKIVDWEPTRLKSGLEGSFGLAQVESLYKMCVKLVAENVEYVESMVGVPDALLKHLSAGICERRKMDTKAFKVLLEASSSEVRVPDCSMISEADFIETLASCPSKLLQVLELGMCGRSLSDQTLSSTIASGPSTLSSLKFLSLKGAYRLSDKGIMSIIQASPSLTHVDLQYCSVVSELGIKALANSLGNQLESLSVEGCEQLDATKLLPALQEMKVLKSLSLSGVCSLTDGVLCELAVALGEQLLEINVGNCLKLTNVGVAALGACCLELNNINLDHIPNLNDAVLAQLADSCRKLSVLSLKRGRFSEKALTAFVKASGGCLRKLSLNNVKQTGDHVLLALTSHSSRTLEELDISWCRQVSNEGLGHLADGCPNLEKLRLFGCSQIKSIFLNGHSNVNLQVTGLGIDRT